MPLKPQKIQSIRNIKLTLEYDGTNFKGWQLQKANQRTVQGEIEKALKKITGRETKIVGSGRTDRGVHALGQVASFKTNSQLIVLSLLKALNAHLPDDITVLKVEDVPLSFHAQYSAKSKTYRYTVLNRPVRCSVGQQYCSFYPYKLNLNLMRREATILMGRKNFKVFQASDPARDLSDKDENKKRTFRTIHCVEIRKKEDFVTIDIRADGFLYKMVRNIVGALLEVGSQKLPAGSIKKMLSTQKRTPAFQTAPAQGLCLKSVYYKK